MGPSLFSFIILIVFFRLIITCRLWVIYVREDNYSNVYVMITWLIWTIWTPMSSVPKNADKLNLSLSLSLSLSLTHRDVVMPCSVTKLDHCLNQCWVYGQLDLEKQTSVQFESKHTEFHKDNAFANVVSKMSVNFSRPQCVTTVWLGDTIWRHRFGSMFQVMACCLPAPSQYLNRRWHSIDVVLWQSFANSAGYQYVKWIWNLHF